MRFICLSHILLVFVLVAQEARGCSCAPAAPESLLESASRAFYGQVEEVLFLEEDREDLEPRIRVTFKVLRDWKADSEIVVFDTVYDKWSCHGYLFEEDDVYAVYAHRVELGWPSVKVACRGESNASSI